MLPNISNSLDVIGSHLGYDIGVLFLKIPHILKFQKRHSSLLAKKKKKNYLVVGLTLACD